MAPVREAYVNTAITEFDFHLHPLEDLRPVRVVPNPDSADQVLWVHVRGGHFDSLSIDVPLNADGTGLLPGSLQGADLHLSLNGSQPGVELLEWNGEAIVIELEDE